MSIMCVASRQLPVGHISACSMAVVIGCKQATPVPSTNFEGNYFKNATLKRTVLTPAIASLACSLSDFKALAKESFNVVK